MKTTSLAWILCIPTMVFATFSGRNISCGVRALSAAGSQSTASGNESVYKYDTRGIKLEGHLIERTFFGPPGFGETPAKDARERVLVLKLNTPITVEPVKIVDPEDIARHIAEVQLFFLPRNRATEARKLLGKTVVVVGTMNEATAPSEHLKVSMSVETIHAS